MTECPCISARSSLLRHVPPVSSKRRPGHLIQSVVDLWGTGISLRILLSPEDRFPLNLGWLSDGSSLCNRATVASAFMFGEKRFCLRHAGPRNLLKGSRVVHSCAAASQNSYFGETRHRFSESTATPSSSFLSYLLKLILTKNISSVDLISWVCYQT